MKIIATVWLGLMALLLLTLLSSLVPLGAANAALNLLIAIAKTALVALFFMHLRRSIPLLRLIALVGLFTLAVLFVLSGADFVTRRIQRSVWQQAQYSAGPAQGSAVEGRKEPAGPPDQAIEPSAGALTFRR